MRHTQGIDILRLISKGNSSGWNEMLKDCYNKSDINALVILHQRLAIGMTDLEKTKMNTDKVNDIFVRMIRSLEITALRIAKKVKPLPIDKMTHIQIAKMDPLLLKAQKKAKEERKQNVLMHFRRKAF